MMSSNIERLSLIAHGLGELNQDVAFVGGSVAELYADDPAATEIRPTEDVDCVIALTSYKDFYDLEEDIRKHGFINDVSDGAPICRWIYKGETVDIMPADKRVLGFSNEWYKPAFAHRQKVLLPDGKSIFVFPVLYYIATKIEAIKGRGGTDLRFSHDLEDLIYVLNNRQNIISLFDEELDMPLKSYISHWSALMLERQNGREEIECVLPYGDYGRLDYIIGILDHFAKDNKQ